MVKKRCLVLGANGFIGSHLVDRLGAEGYLVTAFDRFPRDTQFGRSPRIRVIKGEFQDRGKIEEALEGADFVFHYLWTTYPALSVEKGMVHEVETNLLPSLHLLEQAAKGGVQKVVFPSSSAVYDPTSHTPVSEDHPLKPRTPHTVVKAVVENVLGYFWRSSGLDYLVFRIGNVYGPRQDPFGGLGFIGATLGRLVRGERLVVFGDGSVVRDYIFIDDVIEANIRALETVTGPKVMNLGSGKGRSLNEIITAVSEVVGRKVEIDYLPSRTADIPWVVLDIGQARRELGFEPRVGLKKGIAATWRWMREAYN